MGNMWRDTFGESIFAPRQPAKPQVPVAMRVDEISEQDLDALCHADRATPKVVERLKRERKEA